MNVYNFICLINAISGFTLFQCIPACTTSETDTFKTTVVPNELIVLFHFKYFSTVRENFLRTKLLNSNISNWRILPRTNLASQYPSDFDILRISDRSSIEQIVKTVTSHPSVKAVVPQRSVQRTLAWTFNETIIDNNRRPLGIVRKEDKRSRRVSSVLHANVLWNLGITGKGVKVAIFDTGLTKNHPHFRNVKERTNWTNEKSLDDRVSHGTFVAGVIASSKECLGLAPDAELYIFKVFTNSQVSYTSWFLDAFNYAIHRKVNILNLSIGGPDFMDSPFVEKVLELSANNVIMVSSAGNDGPLYGTLNNPGDQSDVIGVGGIQFDDKIAKFSSRGMTTWELPLGYGRLGLDIVTYGSQVEGSDVRTGCRRLSGTSVSSPVVAGVAALLISGAFHRIELINPASLKQVIIEGAEKLPSYNMFEQGQGKLSLLKSMQSLLSYRPKISLIPPLLDYTSNYMWPYSSQPLYFGSSVAIVNVTILNGISVASRVVGTPKWIPDVDHHGQFLKISTRFSPILWPWTGWMAVYIAVHKDGEGFEGVSKGNISLVVESLRDKRNETLLTEVIFPLTIKVTQKPPRNKRILWDQYHSLRYPPRYIPRDDLKVKSDPLDWRADHIHTNFKDMYTYLRNVGYYVDVLREPYTCFNASDYGTLLVVDPEKEFDDDEVHILQEHVHKDGLSVIIFADWYNTTVMKKIKFFDENTRQWWIPDTGGANIPALNDLLKPFGIAFGDFVGEGHFKLGDHSMYYASGTTIVKFPSNPNDIVVGTSLNDQGLSIMTGSKSSKKEPKKVVPILGLFQTNSSSQHSNDGNNSISTENSEFKSRFVRPKMSKRSLSYLQNVNVPHQGRIAVYGDSNCLDSTHIEKACYWVLITFLDFAMNSHKSSLLQNLNRISEFKKMTETPLPLRISSNNSKAGPHDVTEASTRLKHCEQLDWIRATSRKTNHHLEEKLNVEWAATSEREEHQNNQIKQILDAEIIKLSQDAEYLIGSQSEFSLGMSMMFIFSLSFIVVVLFILFVKKRFIL
ncbi:membrane-bound transcription factor site-1 protease [Drosophila obscura]|uniref:membrane-bound transcription factor site-1 protease n=1 Tax=Drosophila obscura TaxID=7282 RepID=UPI001BB23F61|nr:membrane-bound transcription factor site-1 protease [Drosophila obscura]